MFANKQRASNLKVRSIPTKAFVSLRLHSLTKASLIVSPHKKCITALFISAIRRAHHFNKKAVLYGRFFYENHETDGFETMRNGFDKEEQAGRKYRRTCDDAAASVARQS